MDYQTQTTTALAEALQSLREKDLSTLAADSANRPATDARLTNEVEILQIECELMRREVRDLEQELHNFRANETIYSKLGQRLSSATTREDAAQIIAETAEELFGWDAFALFLYVPESDTVDPVLSIDVVDGKRVRLPNSELFRVPSPRARRVLSQGAELILKEGSTSMLSDAYPFGDKSRPSASILSAPVRSRTNVVGVLSIHSYTPQFYQPADVERMQKLADHCGAALERISAEEKLAAERKLLRTLIDHLPQNIFVKDTQMRFLMNNLSSIRFLGASSQEEVLGKTMADIFSGEVSVGSHLEDQRALNGENIVDSEMTFRDGSGNDRCFVTTRIPLRDEQNKIIGLVGISHDVTDRKQIEHRSQIFNQLSEKLNTVTSAREAGEFIADAASRLLQWDAFSLSLYSSAEDRLYCATLIDIISGKRQLVPQRSEGVAPNELEQSVLSGTGQLILKSEPLAMVKGATPFGDTSRPSASLILVPVRSMTRPIAILSIHSYTLKAYGQDDFELLQKLADHCGSALERIHAERALRESNARLRRVVESNMIGIIFWDRQGHITDANEVFLKTVGYTAEDLRSGKLRWDQMTPPEFRDADLKARAELNSKGTCTPFEKVYVHKDGRRIPVLLGSALLEGVTDRGVSFVLDISDQKRTEQRNEEFSQLGQSLSSTSAPVEAAQVISDAAQKLLGWDSFFLDLFSEEKDELTAVLRIDTINGRKVSFPRPEQRDVSARARRILKQGAELQLKDEPIKMSDDAFSFGNHAQPSASLMTVPIRNRNKVIGLLGIQSYRLRAYEEKDLAVLQLLADHCGGALERIRAEQALRESESRFRRLAELNLIGITFWNPPGQIVDANDAFLQMTGFTRQDLAQGKINSLQLTPPEFHPLDQEALAQLHVRGFCTPYEKQYFRSDGSRVDVLAGAAFLEGYTDRGVSFVLDISNRRSFERRSTAFAKLAEKLSATTTPLEAAQMIAQVADELLGWDSCYLDLYRADQDTVSHVLNMDLVYGRRKVVKTFYSGRGPSPMQRRVLKEGPKLILRSEPYEMSDETRPYGNMARASASLMYVPIRNGAHVIGFFSIQSYKAHAYAEKDLSTLQTLADHCGAALERIRAQDEISTHARQHSAVAQLGLRAMSGAAMNSLMQDTAALVAETLGVDFSEISRLEADSRHLVLQAGTGWKKGIVGSARISAEPDSLVGHVLQTHAPIVIENLKLEFRFSGLELLHDHDLTSAVVLLIPGREKPWGILGAYSTQRRSFSQDDINFLQAVVNLLAETIERKRFEQRLQTFKEIDYAVLTARSSEAIADVTLRGAERLLPCDAAMILVFDDVAHITQPLAIRVHGAPAPQKPATLPDPFTMAELMRPEKEASLTALAGEVCSLPSANFQAVLALPLHSSGSRTGHSKSSPAETTPGTEENLIGVLILASERADEFIREHREIARELANQLSIALLNAQLFEQVSAGRQRLQTLSLRLEEVQDQERRNLARELHDEIGQILTGLKMFLEIRTRTIPEAYQASLGEARQLVSELLKRVQELSLNLRPQLLDDLGLIAALQWHFHRYTAQTEIEVEFKHAGLEKRLPPEVERTAYRIVQEGLTNVARHARVREVAVRLWISQGTIGIQVEDKGLGFDPAKVLAEHVSCGLSGMRERVALLGGHFNLDSAPGSGTQLTIELPLTLDSQKT